MPAGPRGRGNGSAQAPAARESPARARIPAALTHEARVGAQASGGLVPRAAVGGAGNRRARGLKGQETGPAPCGKRAAGGWARRPCPAPPSGRAPSLPRPRPHLQTRLCSQVSKGARQEGGAEPGPEKAQAGTKVWRRRSAHAGLAHGQKSSAWVSACGPRAKKRRRARRQRTWAQPPDAAGPRHCATYWARSRWHRASAVHASAAATHRFRAAELGDPGGGVGRLQFSVRPTSTFHRLLRPPKMQGAQNSRGTECGPKV